MKRDKDNNIVLTSIEFNDLCTNTRKSEREMARRDLIEKVEGVILPKVFGKRCLEYQDGCPLCELWRDWDKNKKVLK